MTLIEKLQEQMELRAKAWEAAKKADAANDNDTFRNAVKEVDTIDGKIEALRKAVELEERGRKYDDLAAEQGRRQTAPAGDTKPVEWKTEAERRSHPLYHEGFNRVLTHRGPGPLDLRENRAIRIDLDYKGGFFLAPNDVEAGILKIALDEIGMRKVASVKTIDRAPGSDGMVMLARMSGANWGSELSVGSQVDDLDMSFRKMFPHPLGCYALISNDLLDLAGDEPLSFVKEELTEVSAVTEEDAFLNGDGNKKPLGLMVQSDLGVPTSRDYAVGSTSTLTADGLIGALYSLRPKYMAKAVWGLHRDAIRVIRQFKDSTNQYLWQPSYQAGQPDTLLGKPIVLQEKLPAFSTWTTNSLVGWVGDPKYYRILDRKGIEFKTDASRYVMENQTVVIMRRHLDGQPLLGEAFSRLKLAAS